MTDLNLPALRAIAEAATPGEWIFVPPHHSYKAAVGVVEGGRTYTHAHAMTNRDAAFVAAFNPVQAIALLDRIELLERLLGEACDGWAQFLGERLVNVKQKDKERLAAIREEMSK